MGHRVCHDYTFYIESDDGMRLWVDEVLLIDEWQNQPATQYEAVHTLTAGEHEVKVEYYESTGGSIARVWWLANSATFCP